MAAPSALSFYDSFKKWIADGTFDLDGSSFVATLHTSSYTPNAATQSVAADLSAEVANGNGYTTGGNALGSVTWTETGGTATWDASDTAWTGSGSGFVARYLVIRASGTLNGHVDPLVGYMLLDSAPADVSFAAGNTVTVAWNAGGIFTLS